MRLIGYLIVAFIFGIVGYKIAEVTIKSKQIIAKINPIVDSLRNELSEIQGRISLSDISDAERYSLSNRKEKIVELLSGFYGESIENIMAQLK